MAGNSRTISGSRQNGGMIDHSGEIDDASTSQEILPHNAKRSYFVFQNVSNVDMWISFGQAATNGSGSLLIPSGQGWVMEGNAVSWDTLTVWCASDSKEFTCFEME